MSAQIESTSPVDGLTLAEVRDIAAEVGVEARFINRAAASLIVAPTGAIDRVLGGPLRMRVTQALDRPLSESERLEILDIVRQTLNHTGEINEVMGTVEWKSVGGLSETRVTVASGEEDASIRVFNDASGLAALTWIGSTAGGIFAAIGVMGAIEPVSGLISVLVLGGGAAAGVGMARAIWSKAAKALRKKTERLRDEIASQLGQ